MAQLMHPKAACMPGTVQLASQKLWSAGRLEPVLAIGNLLPRFLLEQLLTAPLYYRFLNLPFIGGFSLLSEQRVANVFWQNILWPIAVTYFGSTRGL